MLYHPQSPYYQQFLTSTGNRLGRRADAAQARESNPITAAVGAAQARAANGEKWVKHSDENSEAAEVREKSK